MRPGVRVFRVALILLSSLMSACVTALAGPISFVGIAVPHITRSLLKSSKPAYVIPASFFASRSSFILLRSFTQRFTSAWSEISET